MPAWVNLDPVSTGADQALGITGVGLASGSSQEQGWIGSLSSQELAWRLVHRSQPGAMASLEPWAMGAGLL